MNAHWRSLAVRSNNVDSNSYKAGLIVMSSSKPLIQMSKIVSRFLVAVSLIAESENGAVVLLMM